MYTAPNNKAALPQQGLLNLPLHVRVGTACNAYFPHHRQHITAGRGIQLPRRRPGGRHILPAPERDPSVAEKAAAHILSGEWQQQLATAVPEVQKRALLQAQAANIVLAGAAYQAHAMWQYVVAYWPAWQASLQEDVEILLEYSYGLIPAWFAVMHATVLQACQDAAAREPVQLVLTRCAAAAAAAEASAIAATEAVQRSAQLLAELVKFPTPSGEAGAKTKSKQSDQDDHHKVKRGSGLEAARVAYSIAWFGWFGTPSALQLQQPFQQLAQQMSLHDWQQLQQLQDSAAYEHVQPRRWRKPQRRDWIDRVVSRATQTNSSSSTNIQSNQGPTRDHMWRPRHEDSTWAAPVRQVAGALQSAQHSLQQGAQGLQQNVQGLQQGVQGCVEAVQATGRAAVGGAQGGMQRATTMLVVPVQAAQAAVQRLEPPPAGVVAAGVVLLAGAITSTLLRRQQEAQQLAVQQRVVLKQSAEQLKAQKARIMGVLSVEVPNSASSSRRKGAAPPARASIPVTLAGPAAAAELDADDFAGADAAVGGVGSLRAMEMDPEAAAMWKKFLAGSRAMDVPMWNNKMVDDLPKVSRKDIDRQTQKIRSAAAPEEQAALEAADMEQLTRQLQNLDHAPIGRKARAAWLQEKQQRLQQGQGRQDSSSPSRASSSSPAGKAEGQEVDGNPFAISPEVRSKWDDFEADGAPPARKPISRPLAPSSSSRPGSRSGSRSSQRSSPTGGSDNPFAIPADARKQWEAEDHMFSGQGKPILGPLGGILATFTSGKAQPKEAQQHQQRRRQAIRAEEVEAAAILRLQQQVEQQEEQQRALRGESQRGDLGGLGRNKAAGSASLPPRQQQQPAAQAVTKQQQQLAVLGRDAAVGTGAAAATPAGFEGLEEGSPEWAEKMRQVMLQSGAARRARMQQMRGQMGGAAQQSAGTAAAAPQPAAGGQGQSGSAAERTEAGSGSLSAAVSTSDAQSVTAAIPSKGAVTGSAAAEPAETAQEQLDAESNKKVNQGNPFAV